MLRHRYLLCLGALFLHTASAQYLKFTEVESRLTGLARQNPTLVKLTSIGSSAGGKQLHLLTIATAGAKSPEQRQAVFVGANLVGFHNAGTHAALAFAEQLVAQKDEPAVKQLLESRVFYIAPALNPDAHDSFFAPVKQRVSYNAGSLDRDRDGLVGEDGPNDLNGDGRITLMRIEDPAGEWMVDEKDPRVLRRADRLKGERGKYRLMPEGIDDDGDGQYNEDPPGGYRPDKNFAHAWAENDPEAGPWPSAQPETKSLLDFFLGHRNIALAFVYGPANNLLEMPRGIGVRTGDVGSRRVKVSRQLAAITGLEADKEFTIDEIYEVFKDTPFGRQRNFTKDQLAQFLEGGPVRSPEAEDLKFYQSLAADYKKILEKSGLDTKRRAAQSQPGGLQNWLYYQYSVMAIELDVWGIPKKAAANASPRPAERTAPVPLTNPDEDTLAYLDSSATTALVNWSPVNLPNGKNAEVGGVDPFLAIAPPPAELNKATAAHSEAILAMSAKLPEVILGDVEVKSLGSGIYQVKATAINQGYLPTATVLQTKSRSFLPARLEVSLPRGASLVEGTRRKPTERILGSGGTHNAQWLLSAAPGTRISVRILTQNAGQDSKEVVLP
ncbi:MAG: M14 family metallopeptidase [Bryobacter sp.]|nr:M14 family metallopeptidase [Bryobacter sp.]